MNDHMKCEIVSRYVPHYANTENCVHNNARCKTKCFFSSGLSAKDRQKTVSVVANESFPECLIV